MEESNNHNLVREVRDLTSRAIPGVTAIAIGLALSGGVGTVLYQLKVEERTQEYDDSVALIGKVGGLQALIGPKATRGLEPNAMSARLDQAQQYTSRNYPLLSSHGIRGIDEKILEIKSEVAHFIPGWPGNAYQWYPYLHGGTPGVDFELGAEGNLTLGTGSIKTTKAQEFYQGGKLQNLNDSLANALQPHKDAIAKMEEEESNARMLGMVGGGFFALVFGFNIGYGAIKDRTDRLLRNF